jgi:N,N-dimethylformamidase
MDELPITGYLDKLSKRPGEQLDVKVSVRSGGKFCARLVRVRGADPNPDGPGVAFDDLSDKFAEEFKGRRQTVRSGSWGQAVAPTIATGAATWTAIVMPTIARAARAAPVLQHRGFDASLTLLVVADGAEARLDWHGGSASVKVAARLRHDRWHRVWASVDIEAGFLLVGVHTPYQLYEPPVQATSRVDLGGANMPSGGTMFMATADPGETESHFTGKIEDPAVLGRGVREWDEPLAPMGALQPSLLCGWDFSVGIATQTITGKGRQPSNGTLHNLPMRAVVGARWSGEEHCWRYAPQDYAAIKFHEDDLGGCDWQTDFTLAVPLDLRSGAYAIHLSCSEGEDWLPFFVLPLRSGTQARVAFLAPTFTYQAYANFALGWTNDALRARIAKWGAYPYSPDDFALYGRSTYNLHPDRSGIAYSSLHRPILNMRPGFLTFNDGAGSGVRHYASDSHLWGWLEARGIDYDIITDHDLDAEGADLLEPYGAVLTAGHPEYHSAKTLDALQGYVRQGGGLCYLGGNGFYWRVAHVAELDGVIEVRRAENGVRAWAAEPGEYYHALDGKLGGLWKRNRRDPQQVAVTGFSTQGKFEATYFRRTEESYDPTVSWIFEGVEGERFGDYGLNSGGAAGYELDRADNKLGTPDEAVVVARSEGLQPGFLPLMEDLCFPPNALSGGDASVLVRGDMTFFAAPGGGGVFAASSISFCGSLWRDGRFDGPVSSILENVVRRFSR